MHAARTGGRACASRHPLTTDTARPRAGAVCASSCAVSLIWTARVTAGMQQRGATAARRSGQRPGYIALLANNLRERASTTASRSRWLPRGGSASTPYLRRVILRMDCLGLTCWAASPDAGPLKGRDAKGGNTAGAAHLAAAGKSSSLGPPETLFNAPPSLRRRARSTTRRAPGDACAEPAAGCRRSHRVHASPTPAADAPSQPCHIVRSSAPSTMVRQGAGSRGLIAADSDMDPGEAGSQRHQGQATG